MAATACRGQRHGFEFCTLCLLWNSNLFGRDPAMHRLHASHAAASLPLDTGWLALSEPCPTSAHEPHLCSSSGTHMTDLSPILLPPSPSLPLLLRSLFLLPFPRLFPFQLV